MNSILQKLGGFFRRLFALGGSSTLCDRCKWDYGDACRRPERPNATSCPDFKGK
ncbi:MAG: hypothetical protein P1V35_14280 [Planctomycetota bacterium]|nr:hypothetical protein [Planctomycetota bacterium]